MRDFFGIISQIGLPVAVVAGTWAYRSSKSVFRRWGTGSARAWPTMSAVIDVVSVSEQIVEGRYGSVETTGFMATLTYFYRNPELQMGELSQSFPLEARARQWAEGYKNKNVLVHVNPKDPSDSVLLKDDLEGLGNGSEPSLEDSLRLEGLPQLKPGYLVLSGISEFVALIGLALTAAAVWIHTNHQVPELLGITLVVMVAFNSVTAWIVSYRADDSHRLQSMLHSYTLFCPTWMRWGVRITGGLLFATWLIANLHSLLPALAQHWLAMELRYWLYLVATWIFLSTGATHAAVLRSQELAHRPHSADGVGIAENS